MKRLLSASFGVLVVLAFLVFVANPRFEAKREALGAVGSTLLSAKYHHAVILQGGARVLGARYNLQTIARATQYMATFGSNTLVFKEIARIAAEADRECALLDSVLDLAARSSSESQRILSLAESACRVEGAEDEAVWSAAYADMAANAQYPSVAAALASQVH